MKRSSIHRAGACVAAALFAPALMAAAPADIPPLMDGPIGTLPHGLYECALPGDAGGEALNRQPMLDFTIGNSSSYRTDNGSGTYLLRGNWLVFSSGPLKDKAFEQVGANVLRSVDAKGVRGDVRCVRTGKNA